jgi:hypothetical protein
VIDSEANLNYVHIDFAYLERTSADCTSSNEGNHNCYDIHSQLKLEKLRDAVVYVSSPHNSFHNAGKIIVREDNITCLLSYIRSSDSLHTYSIPVAALIIVPNIFFSELSLQACICSTDHCKSNVCLLQGWSIVCSIASYCYNFPIFTELYKCDSP